VLGGLAGYAIGYYLLAYVGEPILAFYGYSQRYAETRALFDVWGPWILIAKGWTPFPYKILTIAAGVFQMKLGPFILASIVARAMRFYLVAALLYGFGEPIRGFIERRLNLVTAAFFVLLVGGIVAARYVF
jgi:membrane protein YqaA with SNARE-associated domain